MFKLRVKNFRGFEDETFDFSRINILIGENSAGKSSILKFLLALKQSLQMPYSQDYNLTLSGNEADLGNYYETIYNHETERNLGFAFEFGEDYCKYNIEKTISTIEKSNLSDEQKKDSLETFPKEFDIKSPVFSVFEFQQDLSDNSTFNISFFNENIGKLIIKPKAGYDKTEASIIPHPKCDVDFIPSNINIRGYYFQDIQYPKIGFLGIPSLEEHLKKLELNVEEYLRITFQVFFFVTTQLFLSEILSKIKYINPLLHITEDRIYLKKDKRVINQIKTIYDFIEFMNSKEATKEYQESLTTLLANFGLADEFYIKNTDSTKELRLKLNGVDNNIKDVGFGVSLQFLIFAQTILSESKGGEVLLIEQPEVHLHPRLQAKFIETLLKIGRHNTYFIETHSEHIIRMLQVLVKKQKYDIKSKDVSIQYFRKDGANMVKSNHKIHPDTGKLQPKFPKGFYDVSYNLAFQLTD